jgi:hypothetical protein
MELYTGKVFVYWNLHRKLWSVKALTGPERGRVVHHMRHLTLKNAGPKVSPAGRARVIATGTKNVHAGVTGYLHPGAPEGFCFSNENRVSYNPRVSDSFFFCSTRECWDTPAPYVSMLTVNSRPEVYAPTGV